MAGLQQSLAFHRVAGACGLGSQLVAVTALLWAANSAEGFVWTETAISLLGTAGPSAGIFNWGLILAGLLGLVFAVGLIGVMPRGRFMTAGIASLGLGSIALSATGIFPRSIEVPHDAASVAFYVGITAALFLLGAAQIAVSRLALGLATLAAGVAGTVVQLVPWPFWSGDAIPQVLACLPWSLWTVASAVWLLARSRLALT